MISDYETDDLAVRQLKDITIARLRITNISAPQEAERVQAEIKSLVERGARKLVLDFKYVEYTGSAVLGMLLVVRKTVIDAGGRLVISHAERIAQLLDISKTRKLFELAPDPREAAKLF